VDDLNKKAFGGLLRLLIVLVALLFLPAWTFNYWQAWVFLAVFFGSALAVTIYLVKNDPQLLARRVRGGPSSEKRKSQRVIQALASAGFFVMIIFPALDHRFAWSTVPAPMVVAGDVLVACGFLVVFFVFKENTFAASTIVVDAGQRVISTGPYSVVRHPMYSGALVMLAGVPLALGSWWGLLAIIPIGLVLAWRLLDEEKFLAANLPGYSAYRVEVKYRLLPFLW
jgi:protein-S-isoprenylcysteine O-methyltransferase Ste14